MKQNRQLSEVIKSISITHKFDKNELIFLNTSDILEGKILSDKYFFVSELKGQAKKTIQNNDILYSEIRPKNKRFAFVNVQNPEDYVVSTKLMVLRNITDDVDTKYIYYFLTYEGTINYLQMRAENRIGSFPQITFDILKPINISLPRLEEQKKIVKIISSIDKKIELNNKINKELESMAKTLYDYWFVQFDFPDVHGKPYKSSGGKMVYNHELKREIPEGWEVDELKNLISIERGISYKSSDITDMGIPMVNLNSFYLDGTYKPEGIKYFNSAYNNNKIVKAGDLIIATTDVTRNADIIGKATLIPDIYNSDIILSCDIAKINCKDSLNKYFLEKLFNSDFYHNYIKGFASGTLVLHLNTNGIDWYKTFIPPNNLLNKFSNILAPIQRKKELITLENQELAKLRDWLLPMLMNGQVRVK